MEVTTLFSTDAFSNTIGTIRIEAWPEGLVFSVGGRIQWRSWLDENKPVPHWLQKGFTVISDGDGPSPFMHSFHLTKWEAEVACCNAAELPGNLRRNIRVVPSELNLTSPWQRPPGIE